MAEYLNHYTLCCFEIILFAFCVTNSRYISVWMDVFNLFQINRHYEYVHLFDRTEYKRTLLFAKCTKGLPFCTLHFANSYCKLTCITKRSVNNKCRQFVNYTEMLLLPWSATEFLLILIWGNWGWGGFELHKRV